MPKHFTTLHQRNSAARPRIRLPNGAGKIPKKIMSGEIDEDEVVVATVDAETGKMEGFDAELLLKYKQNKEKNLAERARIAAEREQAELHVRKKELIPADDVQRQLEIEHQRWLDLLEEWRQAISKKLGKLGIPVEMQEGINEMIMKETTILRQKRSVAE